jgi:hypothetical protein
VKDEEILAASLHTMDIFIQTFNDGDARGHCSTFAYPHVRLASGQVRVWDSIDEAIPPMERAIARLRTDGWTHSEWDHRRMVQIGETKIHMDVQFRRYKADGTVMGIFPAMYVIVNEDGRWLIQCRSSFAP